MSTSTLWAPTRAELDEMTARTAATNADPSASLYDRQRVAELEEKAHHEFLLRPGADAELQRDAEKEGRRMSMWPDGSPRNDIEPPDPWLDWQTERELAAEEEKEAGG